MQKKIDLQEIRSELKKVNDCQCTRDDCPCKGARANCQASDCCIETFLEYTLDYLVNEIAMINLTDRVVNLPANKTKLNPHS